MDDHPGGDEVLLSATGKGYYVQYTSIKLFVEGDATGINFGSKLVGKDATNDFEDVGHSDYAREMMEKYNIGEIDSSTVPLKRTYVPPQQAQYNPDKTPEFVIKILQFLVPLLILGLAFAVRHFTKKDQLVLKSSTMLQKRVLVESYLQLLWNQVSAHFRHVFFVCSPFLSLVCDGVCVIVTSKLAEVRLIACYMTF